MINTSTQVQSTSMECFLVEIEIDTSLWSCSSDIVNNNEMVCRKKQPILLLWLVHSFQKVRGSTQTPDFQKW